LTIAQVLLPIDYGIVFIIVATWEWMNVGMDAQSYFDVFCGVPAEVIENSLWPISKRMKRETMDHGSSQLSKRRGWQLRVDPILIILTIVMHCLAMAGALAMAIGKYSNCRLDCPIVSTCRKTNGIFDFSSWIYCNGRRITSGYRSTGGSS
jgi:uncharacterized membrane protein